MTYANNMQGLHGMATGIIERAGGLLETIPFAQGPDRQELRVRFWATLMSMAQQRYHEELLALASRKGS
jgi:hypothetical protein